MRRAVIFDREARIRERRGALLFALNKESAAKVNRRRFLSLTFFWIYLKDLITLHVTWLTSDGRGDDDVAQSQELMREDC